MKNNSRRTDLVLYILDKIEKDIPVTQLQKILYDVQKTTDIFDKYEFEKFSWASTKMGAESLGAYDEVEFLKELDLVMTVEADKNASRKLAVKQIDPCWKEYSENNIGLTDKGTVFCHKKLPDFSEIDSKINIYSNGLTHSLIVHYDSFEEATGEENLRIV